jgi:hypothetical protein
MVAISATLGFVLGVVWALVAHRLATGHWDCHR